MATQLKDYTADPRGLSSPAHWDVSTPDIYYENRWGPIFREMRDKAPINFVNSSHVGDYWNVTTAKAIQHVESLPDIFSSSYEHGGITIMPDLKETLPDGTPFVLPMFIAMDRPEHTAERRVIAPAFTPAEMKRMSDDIRLRCGEVLDSLPIGKTFDWVDKVSIELTTQMLAILFDFPWEDRRKLTLWSDWAGDVELAMDESKRPERMAMMMEMGAYFQRLWDERLKKDEAPDLISRMVHSGMRDMSHLEYIGNLILLIVGGNDTTRNSMSGYIYGLNQFPDEREKLEKNPEFIPNAVSEIIRWQTPLAHMRRTAVQDYDLFGHQILAGDKLGLWYLSANHDDSVFENADKLIVDRPNARRHLSFGYGIHRCVGARLAELQISILLEEMAKRRLRANVEGAVERVSACFVHGYRKMDVTLSHY